MRALTNQEVVFVSGGMEMDSELTVIGIYMSLGTVAFFIMGDGNARLYLTLGYIVGLSLGAAYVYLCS